MPPIAIENICENSLLYASLYFNFVDNFHKSTL